MKIGYVRVSTLEQHEERQTVELTKKAHVEKIFLDKLSGKDTDRPQLQAMLEFAREGDTVYVSEFSRLARSTKDLLEIVESITEKKASIRSLKDTWLNTGPDNPYTHFLLIVMSGLSQLERDLVSQRTREGLRAAKARGRCGGRPSKTNNYTDTVQKLYQTGAKINEIARMTGLSRSTVNRIVKQSDS